jgi:hypothetical protein
MFADFVAAKAVALFAISKAVESLAFDAISMFRNHVILPRFDFTAPKNFAATAIVVELVLPLP